jgi:enoyl-CoA hydratase/carnithine racemase
MPTTSSLSLAVQNRVASITLARAERRNALDTATWQLLQDACATIANDSSIRAVTLAGAGEHFSAGADIHELAAHIEDAGWMAANQRAIAAALDAWAALPQPTIAIIRGSCFGGGAALAAAADFRIARDDARFAITPSKLGLTYRLVDCLRVVDLVGSARAREILLLARELDVATALTWGFVTEVAATDALNAAVDSMVQRLVSLSGYSARGIKQSLRKIRAGQATDDAETRAVFAAAFEGADFQEGARAFIEKRKAVFD